MKLPFEDIAFPRGCKEMSEYADPNTIYKRTNRSDGTNGAPIQVRGALVYNHYLKQLKLHTRYPLVQDGDKIKFCYMKLPNPLRENVVSVVNTLPRQLELDQYIDYDTQFHKAFIEPIKTIMDAIGWRIEKRGTLEDFFE